MSPAEFIPVAEDTGLIVAIGQWVLETACRQAAEWRRTIAPDLMLAVNLSPRQFHEAPSNRSVAASRRRGSIRPRSNSRLPKDC